MFIQNYEFNVAVGSEVFYAAFSSLTDLLQNDGRSQSGVTASVLREQFQSEQPYDDDPYTPVSLICRRHLTALIAISRRTCVGLDRNRRCPTNQMHHRRRLIEDDSSIVVRYICGGSR